MKNLKRVNIRLLLMILITTTLFCFASCNNYENPGNNSGKTGDGTVSDSLKAKKSDTGKGANQLNKLILKKGDSVN
jgi:hypothetical protein